MQATYLLQESYLDYIKKSQNVTVKNKEQTNLIKKWANSMKGHLTEQDIWRESEAVKDVQHH